MKQLRRFWYIGLGLLLAIVASVLYGLRPSTPPLILRPIPVGTPDLLAKGKYFPAGTPTPAARPGIIIEQDYGTPSAATPGIVGSHYQQYWSSAQGDLTATPDWRAVQTRIAQVKAAGLDSWVSVLFYSDAGGTTGDVLYAPIGVPTVTYYTTPAACQDYGPDYGDPLWQTAYDNMVTSLITNTTNAAGYFVGLGQNEETIPVVGGNAPCADGVAEFEKVVSCAEYTSWVEHALATWRANTTKPLFVNSHETACNGWSDFSTNDWLMNYITTTNLYIGYRSHGLQPGQYDAVGYAPYRLGLGKLDTAPRYTAYGGAAFSPGYAPATYPTAEARGAWTNMAYAAVAYDADNLIVWPQWYPYITSESEVLAAITKTIGTDATNSPAVWAVFRAAEFKRIGSADYSSSDVDGSYTHLLSVSATATPVCIPNVYATAVAGGGERTTLYL